jgi:Tfp pilus assembly protein PilF
VSLLMDALRKAEQQKQQRAAQGQSDVGAQPASGLELEPISFQATPDVPTGAPLAPPPDKAPASPGTTRSPEISSRTSQGYLPELPSRLEDLDEQFMAHHAAQPPLQPRPTPAAVPPAPTFINPVTPSARDKAGEAAASAASSPEAARKLFEAKQPAQKNNRSFAIAIGLITLVAAVGIGGYFWWQLQPKGGMVASSAPPVMPPPAAAPIAVAPAPATPPPPQMAAPVGNVAAVPPAPTFSSAATPAAAAAAIPQQKDDEEDAATPPVKRAATKPAQPAPAAVSAAPPSPIRLTAARQKTDPLLEQAYQAFNRGDANLARSAWQKVLTADPRNADALHGMAALAQQNQQPNEAADYYLRALEADPRDALALSGLISLRMPADTQQTESRLKTLLSEQPDSPYLNFALGNLYARNTRWADAQQSFFRAHAADPSNPDYLFNLAVSLDQLHQPRLAVQYYNQALAAAGHQPAGFDAAQITARLKILQSGL